MTESKIIAIRGAKTHNLKNISIDIPRKKLVVITGISGSGKSSLAFDTLFAEGQRRYVQSLSTYARQFVDLMDKPEVESISGLSPAISIEQKTGMHNPRSTVGTVTEIYDFLRLLYARAGSSYCPEHQILLNAQSIRQMIDQINKQPENTKINILAPVLKDKKGAQKALLDELRKQGFIRIILNSTMMNIDEIENLPNNKKNNLSVVIDRLKVKEENNQRLAESLETALKLANGSCVVENIDAEDKDNATSVFSNRYACSQCGFSIPERTPKMFSFNSVEGACQTCDGLGILQRFDPKRLITNENIAIKNGAIKYWDKPGSYYHQLLIGACLHFGIDTSKPWKDLTDDEKGLILEGGGKEKVPYRKMGISARFKIPNRVFEGVLPCMQRRYLETESEVVRKELANYLSPQSCPSCNGSRLNPGAQNTRIGNKSLAEVGMLPIDQLVNFLNNIEWEEQNKLIATPILKEIESRLTFLMHVGLDYLNLNRPAETLSGGEAQRIRLASQIGSGLTGVMYILDEPSIGLHQRDNIKLIQTLETLKALGNSVIVVEHDEETMLKADQIIDIGPEAGINGGRVIAQGPPESFVKTPTSLTGEYLSGKKNISVPKERNRPDGEKYILIKNIRTHNLKNIDLKLPLGLFITISGVSGSGKSTMINKTLYPALHNKLERYDTMLSEGLYDDIEGTRHLDKIIQIDQSPIGRTPRSNPATYTGMFGQIRDLFSQTPESRARGYKPGRFSFNVKGGRCEACQGDGLIRVEMHFLADVYVSCQTCHGKRYNAETLEIKYKGKNIHDILSMSVKEAYDFFEAVPGIQKKLKTLCDVGLDYIALGQSATTLSGGEAQRMKLSRELSKRDTGRTLYILDEPTTGLHFHDVKKLLEVLNALKAKGNTLVVIEHNLDVIKTSDWVIDIGPEGGDKGGFIVGQGSPEHIASIKQSHTGKFLKPLLAKKKAKN